MNTPHPFLYGTNQCYVMVHRQDSCSRSWTDSEDAKVKTSPFEIQRLKK